MITNTVLRQQWLPEPAKRVIVDTLLAQRLREIKRLPESGESFFEKMSGPIAVATADANEQHYEVPTEFYIKVLGKALKYSCAWFESAEDDLCTAETQMLEKTMSRANIQPNQRILDCGCGWGSFTLTAAKAFPESSFVALSNSATQRAFIEQRASVLGLDNVTVVTGDINTVSLEGGFDRIVSIEMIEHCQNWEAFLAKLCHWLKDDGQIFIHHFCHVTNAYPFEVRGPSDWMAKYFFTGGIMPSADLMAQVPFISIDEEWTVNGKHYALTCDRWRHYHHLYREDIIRLFEETYPDPKLWWAYWDFFFLSCERLFQWNDGNTWFVKHYRLNKRT